MRRIERIERLAIVLDADGDVISVDRDIDIDAVFQAVVVAVFDDVADDLVEDEVNMRAIVVGDPAAFAEFVEQAGEAGDLAPLVHDDNRQRARTRMR